MASEGWKDGPGGSAWTGVSDGLEPKGCLGGAAGLYGLAVILVGAAMVAVWWLRQGGEDPGSQNRRLAIVQLDPLLYATKPIRSEDLQGHVVVLNFWGTWCPPCLLELPHLAELERKYRGREGLLFLAVSCGPGHNEDFETIRSNTSALLANQGIEIPTYVDPGWITRRAVDEAVGFQGYPTTLLLDRQGSIRRVWVGFDRRMPAELERLMESLLSEQGSTHADGSGTHEKSGDLPPG